MTIGRRTLRHVASWEAPDRHQSKALSWSRSDGWSSSRDDHDRTAGGGLASWSRCTGSVNPNRSSNWSPSDGLEALWKNSTIAVRSNRDRGAIQLRSGSLHGAIASNRSENDRRLTRTSIVAWSWPDRGSSWGENRGHFEEKSKRNCGWFQANPEATSSPSETVSTTHEFRPHDRINCPRSSGQFPSLKSHVLSLCSSTFDRLVKKLSEFQERSPVHRDPRAFRLNCEAIGAGLITNFSMISLNFPLEFRMSLRKNPSKFASINENWSPILAVIRLVVRFNRLSRGNLSFY